VILTNDKFKDKVPKGKVILLLLDVGVWSFKILNNEYNLDREIPN